MKPPVIEQAFRSFALWSTAWDAGSSVHPSVEEPLLARLEQLHRFNYDLWNQEDIARRTDVADSVIRQVKRAIDRLNQQRNDAIEAVDEWLLATYYSGAAATNAELRTETPGSVFDRLSILSLKILRSRQQTERADAAPAHVAACQHRLRVLLQQRADLHAAFRLLATELNAGVARMRIYRQLKMYNDPDLNPQLYGAHDMQAGGSDRMTPDASA